MKIDNEVFSVSIFLVFVVGAIAGACIFAEIDNVIIDKRVVHEVCQELTGDESAYYKETGGLDLTFVCVIPTTTTETLDEGLIIIERR